MPVTRHPPHRSRRAELPHRALASGSNAQALCKVLSPCTPSFVPGRMPVAGYPRHCVRSLTPAQVPLGQPPSLHNLRHFIMPQTEDLRLTLGCLRRSPACPCRGHHSHPLWSMPPYCSVASPVLWNCPTRRHRASRPYPFGFSVRTLGNHTPRPMAARLPGPVQDVSVHARGLRPRRACLRLALPAQTVLPSAC